MKTFNDPDILLIKRIQSEPSRDSFDLLYEKYSRNIFNFCINYLGNEEDAKDCTQEIFIKVFRSISGFKFGSLFYTWLYRIMINSCNDMKRKNIVREAEGDSKHIIEIKSPEEPITKKLSTAQAIEAFHEALKELSNNARTIIILRDIEGRSYEEISSIIRCKPGTVRSRLSRARICMAEKLKDYRDEV